MSVLLFLEELDLELEDFGENSTVGEEISVRDLLSIFHFKKNNGQYLFIIFDITQ